MKICMRQLQPRQSELHLERIRACVASGGHDIPETHVRERHTTSQRSLVRLLLHLHHLLVYDNSVDANPVTG